MSAIVQAILGNLLLPLLKLIGDLLNAVLLTATYLVIKFLGLTVLHPDGPTSMAWGLMTSGYAILAGLAGAIMLVAVVWGVIQIQQHTIFGVGVEDTPGRLVGRTVWAGIMLSGGLLYIRALLWINNQAVRLFTVSFQQMASGFGLNHPFNFGAHAVSSAAGGIASTAVVSAILYLFSGLVALAVLGMAIWALVMWFARQFELLFWGAVMPVGLALSVADPQRRIWEFVKTQLAGVIFQQAIMAFVLYLTFTLAAGVQHHHPYGVFRDLMAMMVLAVGFYYSTRGPKYWQQAQGHIATGGSEVAAIAAGGLLARGAAATLRMSRGGQWLGRAGEALEAGTTVGLQQGHSPLASSFNRMGVARDQARARYTQSQASIDLAAGTAAVVLQADAAQAASRHLARRADPLSANVLAADRADQSQPYDPSWGFSRPPDPHASGPGGSSGGSPTPGGPTGTGPNGPAQSPPDSPSAGTAPSSARVPHTAPTASPASPSSTAGGFTQQTSGLWVPVVSRGSSGGAGGAGSARGAGTGSTGHADSSATAAGSSIPHAVGGAGAVLGTSGAGGASPGGSGSLDVGTASGHPGTSGGTGASVSGDTALGAAAVAGGPARNAQASASQAETQAAPAQTAATAPSSSPGASLPHAAAAASDASAKGPAWPGTPRPATQPPNSIPPATFDTALPAAATLVQGEAQAVGSRNVRQSSGAVGKTAAESALVQPAQLATDPQRVTDFADTLAHGLGYADAGALANQPDAGEQIRQAVTGPDGERPFRVLVGSDSGAPIPNPQIPNPPTQATGGLSPVLRERLTKIRTNPPSRSGVPGLTGGSGTVPHTPPSAPPSGAGTIPHAPASSAAGATGTAPHAPPAPVDPGAPQAPGVPTGPVPPAWDPATFPGSGLTPHADPPPSEPADPPSPSAP